LEKAIHKLEKKNVLKKYESKTIFADDIKKTVDQLEATFKELKKQTYVVRANLQFEFSIVKFKVIMIKRGCDR
jgi:hypothetical protein